MNRRLITPLLAAVCFAGGYVVAESTPQRGLTTEVVIVDVYDGDTVVVQPLLPAMRIRILDCWAPEIRTRDDAEKVRGYESRDHLRSLMKAGSRVLLHVPTSDKLERSLSLGRVFGSFWVDVDDDGKLDDVADEMVKAGHATRTKQ